MYLMQWNIARKRCVGVCQHCANMIKEPTMSLLRVSLAIQPHTHASSFLTNLKDSKRTNLKIRACGRETESKWTREVIRVNLFRWQSQNVAYGFPWTQHMLMCNKQLWLIWYLINCARSLCAICCMTILEIQADYDWTAVNNKNI